MSMMSPQVQSADVQTLYALLKFVTDPDCKKNLEELAKQKAEIDAAILKQQAIQREIEQKQAQLDAGAAALVERVQDLDQREAKFEEAQSKFQDDMNAERERLTSWHGDQNKSHADKAEELNQRERELDVRERLLKQRDVIFTKAEGDYNDRVALLKEGERNLQMGLELLEKRRKRITEAAAEV